MELQETYVCGQPDNSELHVHSELQVQDEVGPLIYDLNATLLLPIYIRPGKGE